VALFGCLRYIDRVMDKAVIFSVCHNGFSKFLGGYRINLQLPLAFRGSWIPRSPAKSRILRIIGLPNNNILLLFNFLHKHCDGSYFFFPLNYSNCGCGRGCGCGCKTCSSCPAILIFLAIEMSECFIFILRATARICESTKYEPAKNEGIAYFYRNFCLSFITISHV
jgi:hypothetical protein